MVNTCVLQQQQQQPQNTSIDIMQALRSMSINIDQMSAKLNSTPLKKDSLIWNGIPRV